MKRNIIVIAVVAATLSLLVWAGVENYRLRQLAEQQEREHEAQRMELVPVGPETMGPPSDDQTSGMAVGPASSDDSDDDATPDMSGKPAPEFSLATPDGTKLTLSSLRKQHKAVMINFWATWCIPCKVEMPWLVELQKQYGPQGLQIVGVSEDDPPDAASKVKDYIGKVGVEYPIVLDDGSMADRYHVQDYPTSFYLSGDGIVAAQTVGMVPRDQVDASIRKALAGGK